MKVWPILDQDEHSMMYYDGKDYGCEMFGWETEDECIFFLASDAPPQSHPVTGIPLEPQTIDDAKERLK